MSLYERTVLKDVREFQKLTAEEKEKDLLLHKHQYFSWLLAYYILYTMIKNIISLAICAINLVLVFAVDGIIIPIVFFSTMPIVMFIYYLDILITYKHKHKNQTYDEIFIWLVEKIQNLWLMNWHVISFKDWSMLKKNYRDLYAKVRSEKCNHKCYSITYILANILRNPDIKILWICISSLGDKCGHAVLVKNNRIYDTNLRRTYLKDEYLEAFSAEVFKEYSIEEYVINQEKICNNDFVFLDWEEFEDWCIERDAVRCD